MNKEQILWSIIIGLITGSVFFILGWMLARKTNFKIRDLWFINNIRKARALFNNGEIEKSIKEYEEIRANLQEDAWFKETDFFNMAIIYKTNRNVPECVKYCRKIIKKESDIPLSEKISIAVLCLNNHFYSEALEILLHGEHGDDARWHSLLAWALSKNQDSKKAHNEVEIAFKLSSDDDYTSLNRCGIAFHTLGIYRQAHQCYKKCLSSDDPVDRMFAYSNIGYICAERGNNRARKHDFKNKERFDKAALNFYKRAYFILKENRLWETTVDPSIVLTNLIGQTKDLDEKTEYIDLALEIAPYSVPLYTNISWMYYNIEDYNNALMNAKKCYMLNPNDTDGLEVLTASYLKSGKYYETISTALQAWQVKQDIAHGYLEGYIAEAYEKIGNKLEALKYYKIALAKGFKKEGNYTYFYKKAILLSLQIGDYKKAISLCFDALLYLPENKELQELLGAAIKESGNIELFNFNPFPK